MTARVLVTAPTVEPVSLAEAKAQLRLGSGSLADDLTPVQSIKPGAHVIAAAYSLVGASSDVLGYPTVVQFDAGTFGGGGTADVKLQESDNDSTWTDVSGGAFTQVTTANDETIYEKAYTGTKQYIRPVATVAGATCDFGVSIIKSDPASAEDDLLSHYIGTAREYCEDFQNRAYCTQTWDLKLDDWPDQDYIEIPLPPLQSVTYIKYKDSDGVEYTVDTADYIVDTATFKGRVVLAYGESWPSVSLYPASPITIRFVAGYGAAAAVPKKAKQAMLLLVGHWNERREAAITGTISKDIEHGVEALLWRDRVL